MTKSHPPQTSSIITWKDAPTRSVDVAGTKFVYRLLGPTTGVAVIMHDKMVPSGNSIDLARRLPNAELVLYEDAGHRGIFQYHKAFVRKALEFLAR